MADDALLRAIMAGSTADAEKMIKAGADLNRQGKNGRTPLYVAAFNGHAKLVQLLLSAGADPNIADSFGQRYGSVLTLLSTVNALIFQDDAITQ